jgi:hypothetical protein
LPSWRFFFAILLLGCWWLVGSILCLRHKCE